MRLAVYDFRLPHAELFAGGDEPQLQGTLVHLHVVHLGLSLPLLFLLCGCDASPLAHGVCRGAALVRLDAVHGILHLAGDLKRLASNVVDKASV